MDFKIFISYSTKDLGVVDQVKSALETIPAVTEVFIAEYSVSPGEELSRSITRAIEACDLFVLLWGKNAKESEWVPQEIGKAEQLKKNILPLILDETIGLPGFISNQKYLSFSNNFEAYSKVQNCVQAAYDLKLTKMKAQQKSSNQSLLVVGALFWLLNQNE